MNLPSDIVPETPRREIRLCEHCGLPLDLKNDKRRTSGVSDRFCCYGCYLTQRITGTQGEEGSPALFLARLGFAAFLAMNAMTFTWALYGDHLPFLFPVEPESRQGITYLIFLLSLPVYLLIGVPFLKHAYEEFSAGNPGVDSLIAVGTTAAFLYSVYSTFAGRGAVYYDTATMVLVLVTLGRYLEANARVKSSLALRRLFSHRTTFARVVRDDREEMVPLQMVVAGDLVRVLPGEEIPVDGCIIDGETAVNESLMTGEPAPVHKTVGDEVLGGSISYDGSVVLRTTCASDETVLARLRKVMEEVQQERSPLQLTAGMITKIFVPSVIILALLTGVFWGLTRGGAFGLMQGLSVLLIACPCALGVGSALAGFIGFTVVAKRGILLKSVSILEAAGEVNEVYFDKTGTLTKGNLRVSEFIPLHQEGIDRESLIAYASSLEARSEHPAGKAIVSFAREHGISPGRVIRAKTSVGMGIEGEVSLNEAEPKSVKILRLDTTADNMYFNDLNAYVLCSYIEFDHVVSGYFLFEDTLRTTAKPAVCELLLAGLDVSIVSGDSQRGVESLGSELGLSRGLFGPLTPAGKLELIRNRCLSGARVAMVGDGINDSPALAAATVGIALRSGTDLSRIAADVTILDDDLTKIPWLITYGRRVRRTIRWNFAWAFVYNIVGVGLAVCALLEPVIAAAAMVLSSSMVILNSTRLAHLKRDYR